MAVWKRCRYCGGKFVYHKDFERFCSPECEKSFNAERKAGNQAAAAAQKGWIVCRWCEKKKPPEAFRKRAKKTWRDALYYPVCLDCMPFDSPTRRIVTKPCGKDEWVADDQGTFFPMFSEPTCDLYENCRERLDLGLDPACFVPDRRSLQVFMCLAPEDQRRAAELYQFKLDEDWGVAPDSIYNYLSYFGISGDAEWAQVPILSNYAVAGGD